MEFVVRRAITSAIILAVVAVAQLSNPITDDSHVHDESNKFLTRDVSPDTEGLSPLNEEDQRNSQCPSNLELKWQTEVASSIYATPAIADINNDGRAEVIVPSFVHYLDVLDGVDGDKLPGWPAFHKSSTHTSPVIADVDGDGEKEILIATYNGEILTFLSTGEQQGLKFEIPRLKVKRNWYKGLEADFVDRKHPDIHVKLDDDDEDLESEEDSDGSEKKTDEKVIPEEVLNLPKKVNDTAEGSNNLTSTPHPSDPALSSSASANQTTHPDQNPKAHPQPAVTLALEMPDHLPDDEQIPPKDSAETKTLNPVATNVSDAKSNETVVGSSTKPVGEGELAAKPADKAEEASGKFPDLTDEQKHLMEAWEQWYSDHLAKNVTFTDDQRAKWSAYLDWKKKHIKEEEGHGTHSRRLLQIESSVEGNTPLDEDGDASWDVFKDYDDVAEDEPVPEQYNYDYDATADNDDSWASEDWTEPEADFNEEMVGIDSHILCTPVVADIDGDGKTELVVAASYFFDREYYDSAVHKEELPKDLDLGKYIAGSIVVFDGASQQVKWFAHLDLSTEGTKHRAYIYSAPTLVDIDKDGRMEIIVGTSVGYIYLLYSDGTVMPGFPLLMGEIQGQIVAADINHDGEIEIVACDTKGNVAVFDHTGKEVWERHTRHLIAQGATIGDVDNDGDLEVVVTTTGGHIWVFNGATGEDHGPFPFRTHGRIMAPALLVNLKAERKKSGLQIVVVSFDGYLYVVDGRTGCADSIDIGETSYSMVLADQLDGGDDLDLIVSTMNGNVLCFQTPAPFRPLKSWPSQNQGKNVATVRDSFKGVFFLPSSRKFHDVSTQSFLVQFEIVDITFGKPSTQGTHYNVLIHLVVPGDISTVLEKIYYRPGVYSVKLQCPTHPSTAQVRVEMFDQHKLYFYDEYSMSFHLHFYRIFKWYLALPVVAMLPALMLLQPRLAEQERVLLPSYRQRGTPV